MGGDNRLLLGDTSARLLHIIRVIIENEQIQVKFLVVLESPRIGLCSGVRL